MSNLHVKHLQVWIGVRKECEVFSNMDVACFQEDVLPALLHRFPVDGLSFN